MTIVPNEWLVDLLLGSIRDQRVVHSFLDKVERRGDMLALRRRGALVRKLYRAMRDPQKRAKRVRLMLFDSDKVSLVEEHEIQELPEELHREIPQDDLYLVETAFSKRPCLLITTDRRLWQILCRQQEFQVQLLDEFLRE